MTKKQAIIGFTFFDLLSLGGLLILYHELGQITMDINSQVDMIKFGNRISFFFVGFIIPVIHLVGIIEYFKPKYILKYKRSLNYAIIILAIVLTAASLLGSFWIKSRVENAGYIYCRNASGISALAKTLVYTKNKDICEKASGSQKR